MIPEKIKIGGKIYDILKSENQLVLDGNQVYGDINYDKQKIRLDISLQEPDGINQTLIHEILHGIVFDREIDFKNHDEERIINQIAKGLYQIIVDNFKYWGNKK